MSNENFKFWKDEIADMPTFEDGCWYDMETGLAFDPNWDYKNWCSFIKSKKETTTKKLREKSVKSQNENWQKLKGTKKRVKWALDIRSKILSNSALDFDTQKKAGTYKLFEKALFWINIRELDIQKINDIFVTAINHYDNAILMKNAYEASCDEAQKTDLAQQNAYFYAEAFKIIEQYTKEKTLAEIKKEIIDKINNKYKNKRSEL